MLDSAEERDGGLVKVKRHSLLYLLHRPPRSESRSQVFLTQPTDSPKIYTFHLVQSHVFSLSVFLLFPFTAPQTDIHSSYTPWKSFRQYTHIIISQHTSQSTVSITHITQVFTQNSRRAMCNRKFITEPIHNNSIEFLVSPPSKSIKNYPIHSNPQYLLFSPSPLSFTYTHLPFPLEVYINRLQKRTQERNNGRTSGDAE